MQSTSATWKSLLYGENTRLEAAAVIAGTEYAAVSAPVISRGLTQNGLSIGNAVSANCRFSVMTGDAIPRSATVQIRMRLTDGETASEWLPAGTFMIGRRSRDPITGLLTLECYDALLKANAVWTPSEGAWPRSMAGVAAELAGLIGLEMDARNSIRTGSIYVIREPGGNATVNEILGKIAAANGGNWIVTPANRLRLAPVVSAAGAESAAQAVEVAGVVGSVGVSVGGSVTGIRYTADGEKMLAGTDEGIVLDADVTAPLALELLETLSGMTYRPFDLRGAVYDPAAELGDYVRAAGGLASVLYSEQATLGPAFRGDISAPDSDELSDEFPYIGPTERSANAMRAYVERAVTALDDSLDQEAVFNRLTDDGAAQGMMLYNGQLYVNASYIRSGTLVLGGLNNQNGTLRVVNANGEVVGTWTKDGVTIDKGTIHIPNASDARSYVEITGGVLPFKSVKYDENSSRYTRVNVATYGLDVGRFQDGSNTALASTMIQGSAVYVTTNSSDNTARYESTDNYNHRGGTYGTDHVGLYSDAVSWFLLQHANYQYNDTGKNRMWMRGDVQIVGNLSASNLPAFPLSAANGGTGQTSLQATRNAMGLGNTTGALPVANGGTGATTAAGARSNLGAVNKAGDTMTGNLTVQGSMYPKVILSPTYNSTANSAQFEGSYQGSASMQAWQDAAGNNRRVLEVRTRGYQSSLDNALALRDCVSGSWSTYRVFHEGMTTAVPVNKGGAGATTAAAARQNLGIRSGTKVVTLTNGSASVPFSDFGVTSRPDALILTPQSEASILRYDWDNPSSAVVLRYQNADGSTFSGLLRFGWVCV